jgi:hypothetical protein
MNLLQGTSAVASGAALVFTVPASAQMNANTPYTVMLTITNPPNNNVANDVTVTTSTADLLQSSQTIVFTIREFNSNGVLFPYTPLLGVANGSNALKTVIPFEVRTADDVVDTPGAPNVITFQIQTNILFLTTNTITISGFPLPDGTYTLTNVNSSAPAVNVWGTSAVMTSGKLVFIATGNMVATTIYAFFIGFLVSFWCTESSVMVLNANV